MPKRKRKLQTKAASPLPIGSGNWLSVGTGDWTPGAWQADSPRKVDTAARANPVFACVTLIASDVGKLRPKLVELTGDGIWIETTSPAFSPVLRRANRYQNHIQFKEGWITSKLLHGNTYGLLERDARNVVTAIYLLDPSRVTPLVAPDGSIYYELSEDNLAGIEAASIIVPASEIIHDRMNCLFHALVGVSPLYSSGATADQVLKIQNNSSRFFENGSSPGGFLIAPGKISAENAKEMRDAWQKNYGGANAGRIAVLGDGLKFEPARMTAVASQQVETLNLSAQVICSSFHVPPFMVGLGAEPTYSNGETRTSHYYSQCLQSHIEALEACLDGALGLEGGPVGGRTLGVELDLSGLLRMDKKTQIEALTAAVKGSVMKVNEARRDLNLPPVEGGDTIFMQQQNYSLAALDQQPPPGTTPPAPPVPEPAPDPAKALASELAAILELHAEATAKQSQTLDDLQAAAKSVTEARDALSAEVKDLAAQQEAFDAAQDIAQALLKRFTGAGHVA